MKKIGIVGNGFVGSAIAAGFALHAKVRIYDKNPDRSIHSLQETINESDFVFISVPTPMKHVDGGEIDLSILDAAVHAAVDPLNNNPSNKIFVIKSTVVPGTTEKYRKKYPFARFVFNPEFLTERSANLDFINASRIVLGGAKDDVAKVALLYRDRFPYTKIIETDTRSAEFVKYMCNCFFAVKISYMNEMYRAAEQSGCDWEKIMESFVADGRIGNSHLDVPGHDGDFGFGGKCFPKDINAFMRYLKDATGVDPIMLESAWKRNKLIRKNINWAEIEGAVSDEGL